MGVVVKSVISLVISLLAGVGVGKVADKIAPDANLNVTKDIVTNSETGQIDVIKIVKFVAVLTVAGLVAGFILKKIGLSKYAKF